VNRLVVREQAESACSRTRSPSAHAVRRRVPRSWGPSAAANSSGVTSASSRASTPMMSTVRSAAHAAER